MIVDMKERYQMKDGLRVDGDLDGFCNPVKPPECLDSPSFGGLRDHQKRELVMHRVSILSTASTPSTESMQETVDHSSGQEAT